MPTTATACVVEPFSTANAALNSSSDPAVLAAQFHSVLVQELSKRGVTPKESHPLLSRPTYAVEGSFVQIDEGDRALRYFLSFLAGAAFLEVKGWLFQGDMPVIELHARTSQSIGVFGGDSKRMLLTCAAAAGKQIALQVDEAITNRVQVTT